MKETAINTEKLKKQAFTNNSAMIPGHKLSELSETYQEYL